MNQKQKKLIKIVFIIVFVLIIVMNVSKCICRSTIMISNLPDKEVFFNASNKKLKVSNSDDGISKLKQKLEPGEYIIYYDENPDERWYATLRIKKSENEVKLNFRKHKLPHIQKKLVLKDRVNADDIELGNRSWRYSLYNHKNNEIHYKTEINFSLRGKKTGDEYTYTAKWWLDMYGSQESKEQVTLLANENKTFTIFEDKLHRIDVEIISSGKTATFELKSVLAEYVQKN